MSMETKQSTSYRLSKECKRLMNALAEKMGINLTSVLELAVRAMAKHEKVD
jgi:antitoxin component of RelBE/YafQ-DinJ toxin-antitoxin module